MRNTLKELLVQYKNQTGSNYQTARYPNPKVTSPNLIKLVASIKVAVAKAKQLEIKSERKKGEKAGGTFIASDENFPLTDELENLKGEIALWNQYV